MTILESASQASGAPVKKLEEDKGLKKLLIKAKIEDLKCVDRLLITFGPIVVNLNA